MKDIKPEQLSDVYRELSSLVGVDNALLIYENYKGQQVSFPTKLMSSEYITKQVSAEYNGKNVKEIAQKYGYSERWIRKLLKK